MEKVNFTKGQELIDKYIVIFSADNKGKESALIIIVDKKLTRLKRLTG